MGGTRGVVFDCQTQFRPFLVGVVKEMLDGWGSGSARLCFPRWSHSEHVGWVMQKQRLLPFFPPSPQPAYVLQIFPPCEFSESHLSRLAPDLLASISNISPHLMIVIASV